MSALLLSTVLIVATGTARVDRGDTVTLTGEVMILCIRAGFGPGFVEKHFGTPLLVSQFRDGPIEWWYPDLGVTVRWPAASFKPAAPVQRIHGGII